MIRQRSFYLAALLAVAAVASACTSSEDIRPAGSPTAATSTTTAVPADTAPSTRPASLAPLAAIRLQFAPMIGVPVEAAAPLTERLALRARGRGLGLARPGEMQTHVLKGYFSALPEDDHYVIVFVWDVLDPAGERLHRIQGQQQVPGKDGWKAVTPDIMQAIADNSIDQLATWLGVQPASDTPSTR